MMPENQNALVLKDVRSGYGKSRIVQGVSLELRSGEVTALLGRNGAGKSTLIKTILGLVPTSGGEIWAGEARLDRLATHRRVRIGDIGYVPQGRGVFRSLSVEEHLELPRPARSHPWDRDAVYELFPILGTRRKVDATSLSGGEQQMLAIGRALLMNPRVLLLDEPSEGLALMIIDRLGEVIRQLAGEGIAIFLVEQNLHLALDVSDIAHVLTKGTLVHSMPGRDLLENAAVLHEHLGV